MHEHYVYRHESAAVADQLVWAEASAALHTGDIVTHVTWKAVVNTMHCSSMVSFMHAASMQFMTKEDHPGRLLQLLPPACSGHQPDRHARANLSIQAKMHVFASLGSMGIWLSRRPRAVKASSPSRAPRLDSESTADSMAEVGGGVSI